MTTTKVATKNAITRPEKAAKKLKAAIEGITTSIEAGFVFCPFTINGGEIMTKIVAVKLFDKTTGGIWTEEFSGHFRNRNARAYEAKMRDMAEKGMLTINARGTLTINQENK